MTTPGLATTSDSPPAPLYTQIGLFTATRTVVNTGFRMLYPFLPVFARGMGVDLQTAALIVTARSSVGLVSPLLGSTADVWGRRPAILAALGAIVLAMLAVVARPIFPVVLAAMAVAAIAKAVLEPAMWAYLSDRVDYARRGLALALTELSWSSAYLIGMPLVGLAITANGWAGPFPWLAGLTLVGAVAVRVVMPAARAQTVSQRPPSFRESARVVLTHRTALLGMAMATLITIANENVSIVFGQMMEDSFHLEVLGLGLASTLIGVAELAGEGAVVAFVDRIGKRRAVILGVGLNLLVSLALPALSRTLPGALTGLFLFYLTFEFSVVSVIPMMSELVPSARATMMAGSAAAFSLGRALGSQIGPALYAHGLLASGVVGAALDAAAIVLLVFFIEAE